MFEAVQKRKLTYQFHGESFVLTRAEYEPVIEIDTCLKMKQMGPIDSLNPIGLVSTQQWIEKSTLITDCGN